MPGQVTALLREWNSGEPDALEKLAPLIYPELRRIAHMHLRNDRQGRGLTATDLVHEVYVRLAGRGRPAWESRVHFYAIAAKLMRQVLVDFAREHRAAKRGSGAGEISLDDIRGLAIGRASGVEGVHDALNSLARYDERKARILELRFFSGLSAAEIGEALGVSASTVARESRAATAWIRKFLSA